MKIFNLIILLILLGLAETQKRVGIKYGISARNLPADYKLFAEQKPEENCDTNRVEGQQNFDWETECNVEYTNGDIGKLLTIEIRVDRWWWPDWALGQIHVHVKRMTEETLIAEELWDGNVYRGTILIRVVSTKVHYDKFTLDNSTLVISQELHN